MTATDIEAYRSMIQRLIDIGSPIRIHNDGPEHAKIILETMFRATRETAFVFCGCISSLVWDGEPLKSAIEEAIGRNVQVRFLVQHEKNAATAGALYDMLESKGVLFHSAAFAAVSPHFAVFDEKMYRIESSDASKTAVACANGPEAARRLAGFAKQMNDFARNQAERTDA